MIITSVSISADIIELRLKLFATILLHYAPLKVTLILVLLSSLKVSFLN